MNHSSLPSQNTCTGNIYCNCNTIRFVQNYEDAMCAKDTCSCRRKPLGVSHTQLLAHKDPDRALAILSSEEPSANTALPAVIAHSFPVPGHCSEVGECWSNPTGVRHAHALFIMLVQYLHLCWLTATMMSLRQSPPFDVRACLQCTFWSCRFMMTLLQILPHAPTMCTTVCALQNVWVQDGCMYALLASSTPTKHGCCVKGDEGSPQQHNHSLCGQD